MNWSVLKDHVEARTEPEKRKIKEFLIAHDLLAIAKEQPFDKIDEIWKDYLENNPIKNCEGECLARWWEQYNEFLDRHHPEFEEAVDKLADVYAKLYDIDSQNGYREALKEKLKDAVGWRQRLQAVTYKEEIRLIETAYSDVLNRANKARILVNSKMEDITESLCASES